MKELNKLFVILSVLFFTTNIFAQAASVTWVLNGTTQLTSVSVGNVTGSAESISAGSGRFGMSIFDYSSDGQRLWEGTAGWIAGTEEASRYIQFNALPVDGNSFTVTNVSFNYGVAGIDHNMQSNAYYSTDGWVTRTLLNQVPLDYPGSGMSTFTQNVSVTVASGTTFSVRIYPYAIVNSSPMRPTFAVHNSVGVRGTTSAKKNCILQVTNVAGKWGKSVFLTARLQETGPTGNTNLPGRKISVSRQYDTVPDPPEYINSGTTDANGVVSVLYDIPASTKRKVGIWDTSSTKSVIKAEFAGDANYYAQSGTGTLTILKHVTSLAVAPTTAVFGQPVVFTATLTDNDNDGKGVSDQELKFYKISPGTRLGDTSRVYVGSGTTDANGVARMIYQIEIGVDIIMASFAGDAFYSPKSGTGKFTNTLKNCILQITNVAGKWGKSVLLTARLQETGSAGNTNLPGRKISMGTRESDTGDVGPDDIYKLIGSGTSDANGIVSIAYIIPKKSTPGSASALKDTVAHSIKAEFAGDAFYNAQSSNGKLMVVRHATNLIVAPTTAVYGQPVVFTATLIDNDDGGKGVSDQELKFYKISPGTREGDTSRVYIGSGTTNANGVASVSSIWDDTDIVHVELAVTYAGDANYSAKSGTGKFTITVVGVEKNQMDIPTKFDLMQNYPNPFNPTSTIRYDIPKMSLVRISVYDILGKEIRVLVNEEKSPGHYEIIFDAKGLASGIYFYTIRTGDFSLCKKMILMK